MPRLSVVESGRTGASERVDARIAAEENRGLLRFLTCGSVDDGKSTLIGRLLYDSALVYDDQVRSAEHDSRRPGGSRGGPLDLALLVDGLEAEREQKITIDVAYRYFSTPRRKFIVADTPGHVQYTRNMATGASNCDFAVLLVDARSGVLTQTRRHACILSLLGIGKIALAVNKMDLVDFDQARFEAIAEEFAGFAGRARLRARDRHPGLGAQGRQCDRTKRAYALVSRSDAARTFGDGGCEPRRKGAAVPFSGAVGEPAASRFSRLCGDGGQRQDRPRRGGGDPSFGQARACGADRHRRRRSRGGARRRCGDA